MVSRILDRVMRIRFGGVNILFDPVVVSILFSLALHILDIDTEIVGRYKLSGRPDTASMDQILHRLP